MRASTGRFAAPPGRAAGCALAVLLAAGCGRPGTPPASIALPAIGAIGELRAHLQVEPAEATVGDPILVTIEVDVPDGAPVAFPADGGDWGDLTLLEAGAPQADPAGDGRKHRAVYRLAAFRAGTLTIPARQVLVGEGESALPVDVPAGTVEIASVIAGEGEDAAIADIKPPAELPFPRRWLPWVAAGLALALAAAALAWMRRRRAAHGAREAAAPPLPPDVEALQALERLLGGALLAQGLIKEFHVDLAEIAKRYLWRRFGVATLERTTFEVLREARAARLDGWVTDRLGATLNGCDAVKFARHRPSPAHCRAAADAVRDLVLRSRPAPPPDTSAAPAAVAEG